MADECKVTWAISVHKDPMDAPVTDNIFNQLGSISTGSFNKGSVLASHTADTEVPLGDVAGNCGYFTFNNPSPTETVLIKAGSAGATIAECRPGFNSGLIPLPAAATPYCRATGSIDVRITFTLYGR